MNPRDGATGQAGGGEGAGREVAPGGAAAAPARWAAAVVVVDREGAVVDANTLAADHLNAPVDALRGRELFPRFPAEVREARRAVLRSVFESGEPTFFEDHEGERTWDVAVHPIREQDGQVSRVALWLRDVTERKRSERTLRDSEARYRGLVESSPEAITLTDLEGRFIAANPRALALHGCDSLEEFRLAFGTAFEIIVPEDREAAARNARRVLEGGALQSVRYRAFRKDGSTFAIELSASLLRDGAGAPVAFMAVTRDAARLGAGPAEADRSAATGPSAGAVADPGFPDAETERILLGDRRVIVAEPAMRRAFQLLRTLAGSDLPVLILGETGSGKEVAAYAVHHWSSRRAQPFVTLNCAAIPDTLIESELFGYERGAFTGAVAPKTGLLESAHGGTIFLDEVGDLAPAAQAKLLRALETKRISRLGGNREREVDVRILAATHRDLSAEVQSARFRKDLLFRLGGAPVLLPPLRERPREIALFARHFLDQARRRAGLPPLELSAAVLAWLHAHPWPGNVRELRFLMEYAAVTVDTGPLEPAHLPVRGAPHDREEPAGVPGQPAPAAPGPEASPARARPLPLAEQLREVERKRILEAIEEAGGTQREAADLLGMPLRTFQLRLRQFGISTRRSRRR